MIETHKIATQEEVCSGVALRDFAAEITIATVPPKPIRAATTAEMITDKRIYFTSYLSAH